MKQLVFLSILALLFLESCGGGKTIGEVRTESASFINSLSAKLTKAKETINAEPVDSGSTCSFKEKMVFPIKSANFNADYLLEDEINDWTSSIGEGFSSTGKAFSLSGVKFAMTDLTRDPDPGVDSREDTDGDFQKKVDRLKKTKYFVILNKPSQANVPQELVKADFYVLDAEKGEIVCRFATYTPSHKGVATYEENLYEGDKKVSSRGVVENFQTKQADDVREAMKKYLTEKLGAEI